MQGGAPSPTPKSKVFGVILRGTKASDITVCRRLECAGRCPLTPAIQRSSGEFQK